MIINLPRCLEFELNQQIGAQLSWEAARVTCQIPLYTLYVPLYSLYSRQRPRGVAVDFGPKQSGWLINQLGDPSLIQFMTVFLPVLQPL